MLNNFVQIRYILLLVCARENAFISFTRKKNKINQQKILFNENMGKKIQEYSNDSNIHTSNPINK